jgi:tetratricopeptide (TPR) repeat protein
MPKVEWFRRTTWTDRDRDEFNARLSRSRGIGNKAQYLRTQACHLAGAGLNAAAIELLDRMLTEFPVRIEQAMAHLQKAWVLAGVGQIEPAIQEFRAALQAERDFPNVRTQAWLDFAWFAVENEMTHYYDEVSDVLNEFRDESALTFPVIEYRYAAAQSIIADFRGDRMAAQGFANGAMAAASKAHSGLSYHAEVGLVGIQSKSMEKKLRALAGR